MGLMCIYLFILSSVHSRCHLWLGVLQSRVPLILLREETMFIVSGRDTYLEAYDL